MPVKGKINHQKKAWLNVAATARQLSTTTAKVRELMGRGNLTWTQPRANGKLYVSAESIVAYEKRMSETAKFNNPAT
jgi:hypothetical protein